MKWNQNQQTTTPDRGSGNEAKAGKLDRLGKELLQAFEADAGEIHAAATSPFLFRRMMARIAEEENRRNETLDVWTLLTRLFRPAIPALAMCALLTAGAWAYQQMTNTELPEGTEEISIALSNDEVETELVDWNLTTPDKGRNGQ